METDTTAKQRKKPGPKPKNYRRVDVHFYLDADDYEWLKDRPDGFAVSMRHAIKAYRQHIEHPPTYIRPEVFTGELG